MVDEQDTHGGSAPSTGSNGYIRPGHRRPPRLRQGIEPGRQGEHLPSHRADAEEASRRQQCGRRAQVQGTNSPPIRRPSAPAWRRWPRWTRRCRTRRPHSWTCATMVSADGHRPDKAELVRLGIGFTVSAVACAIPWVALSTVILPRVFELIDNSSKEAMLAWSTRSARLWHCWRTSSSARCLT